MDVAVVIPHLNQPDLLARCLRALAAQPEAATRLEIVVVDNGSAALPVEVVAAHPNARLVVEPTPGPGPARNRGAADSRAPLLAFMDADCQARGDWLAALLARFADPAAAIVGGDVRIIFETPGAPTPIEAYEAVYAFRQKDYIERKGFSISANLATRRATFEAVGPFGGIDTAEDKAWGLRARAMGIVTAHAPELVVFHPARPSLDEMKRKWNRITAHDWRDQVEGRGLFRRLRWWLKTAAMPLSPAVEIPRILAEPTLPGAAARLGAFRTLCAVRLHRGVQMARLGLSPAARGTVADWNRG